MSRVNHFVEREFRTQNRGIKQGAARSFEKHQNTRICILGQWESMQWEILCRKSYPTNLFRSRKFSYRTHNANIARFFKDWLGQIIIIKPATIFPKLKGEKISVRSRVHQAVKPQKKFIYNHYFTTININFEQSNRIALCPYSEFEIRVQRNNLHGT